MSGIRKLTLEKGSLCVMNVGKPSGKVIALFNMNSSTLGTAHVPAEDVVKPVTAILLQHERVSSPSVPNASANTLALLLITEGYTV